MAHHDQIVHLEPGDKLELRDRPHCAGCALELAKGYVFYLSPQQEVQLLALLIGRARAMPRAVLEDGPEVVPFNGRSRTAPAGNDGPEAA